MIETLEDVTDFLREYYVSSGSPKIGTNYRLEDTVELAERVGSPHERLKVVHVAGTSGKTSTSYFMTSLLHEAGYSVGLTVSPHIASITERVQLNGEPLNAASFVAYFREYVALATDNFSKQPSFFELMLVFALWVFDKEQVEYAVVETGMGGTYDSSNICRRSDKLCLITDIGFDHTHILGSQLEQIAAHKAGIIAPSNIVCMYEQPVAVMSAVQSAVTQMDAILHLASATQQATFFERNFALARFGYDQLATRDGLVQLTAEQEQRARQTHVPGRLESIRVGKTLFLLDGAHNEQKMQALVDSLGTLYPEARWPVIVAMKGDKDGPAVVRLLTTLCDGVVTSEFQSGQDMPVTATSANELARLFQSYGTSAVTRPVLADAMMYFLEQGAPRVLLTGSLYAVAEARAWLLDEKHGILEA
ncbi:MAG TPA: Mur ligase family protein [Patescibacteria group bacterium]|jgi:dihydrofolate synthase/folylpolyglutamate synthase|nr:Mur ligase family protein [Patescibacteria group bacterium]